MTAVEGSSPYSPADDDEAPRRKWFRRRAYKGSGRPVSTERAERSAQRMVRWLVVFLALSLGTNVLLVTTIKGLFPLVRVQPALVQWSDKAFYKIQPMYQTTTAEAKAREAFARRYVVERETINLVNDRERWEWVHSNSAPEVWGPFYSRLFTEGIWKKLEKSNATRSVKVLSSWPLEKDPTRWAVEYERLVYQMGELKHDQKFIATMILGKKDGRATDKELFDNPFRLTVLRYSVSPKASNDKEGRQ